MGLKRRKAVTSEPARAPLLLLSRLLLLLAALLLLNTLYLFHLHHAHHDPEDDASNLDKLGHEGRGEASPGGSALRHKMGLAQFLLRKHDEGKMAEKGEMQEAMEVGGWKGGSEENFIKMVNEARRSGQRSSGSSEGGTPSDLRNQQPKSNRRDKTNINGEIVDRGESNHSFVKNQILSESSKVDNNETLSHLSNQQLKPNKQSTDNNNGRVNVSHILTHLRNVNHGGNNKSGGTHPTKKKKKEAKYATPLSNLSWQQLQHALLEENLLPRPIPRTRTPRGFSGLPPDRAPALEGARRGTIACPDTDPRVGRVLSSMLAFWNEPRGTRDRHAGWASDAEPHAFVPPPLPAADVPPWDTWSPRHRPRRRYLTFEPDTGGWNNLRISFENLLTLAAVSGRTLVLPPDQWMYLLEARKGSRRERNYNDLLNITDNLELLRRVPIITSPEFLRLEGGEDGLVPLGRYNATWRDHLLQIANACEERRLSDVYCEDLYDHYRNHGQLATVTTDTPGENCFIFDEHVFYHGEGHIPKLLPETKSRIEKFCGERTPVYYNQTVHKAPLWHFETMDEKYRLLEHSYAFLFFTDPKVGNYYKRFVRDFVKFPDVVYCVAGKIILALQYENYLLRNKSLTAKENNESALSLDMDLVGGYSSLHVRRGDLQFPQVRFDSSQWYQNTQELWRPDEVLYIATDESNHSWFSGFRMQHSGPLRFLGDYNQLADLDSIDPTLYGLIETIVASRGSVFAGTWFSTFSGYITRLRGYYGISKYFTYYSWLERKYFMKNWTDIGTGTYYAGEFPSELKDIDLQLVMSHFLLGHLTFSRASL